MFFKIGIFMIILIGVYIPWHAYAALSLKLSGRAAMWLTVIISVLSQFFWINFLMRFGIGIRLPSWVMGVGYTLFVFFVILTMIFIILDVLWLSRIRFGNTAIQAGFALALACLLTAYGMINARITRVTAYDISVDKPDINAKIVFLSDLHIGNQGTSARRVQKTVDKINVLQPDLIILGGDIFDNTITPYIEKYASAFKQLKAKHGVFAILGNHEYYGESPALAIKTFRDWGFTVLRDEKIRIDKLNLTLIGLDDTGRHGNHTAATGSKISLLAKGLPPDDLQVVAVHRPMPKNADVAKQSGNTDAVLSGHTHYGQIFPASLIVRNMYKNAWGAKKFGNTWLVTSSGAGLWGPSVRIGSRSEVVILNFTSENK